MNLKLIPHQRLIESISKHPALRCFLHNQWLMAIDNVEPNQCPQLKDNHKKMSKTENMG